MRREDKPLSFKSSGLTSPIDFELLWPLPRTIGKHSIPFEWYARKTATAAIPIPIGNTRHTICTTWKKIVPDITKGLNEWVYKKPMLWTSEWAAGKDNEKDICDAITQNLSKSNMKYGGRKLFTVGWKKNVYLQPPVRHLLCSGIGMCGEWYNAFQHFAHCQGVFVDCRCFLVDWRQLKNPRDQQISISQEIHTQIKNPRKTHHRSLLDSLPQGNGAQHHSQLETQAGRRTHLMKAQGAGRKAQGTFLLSNDNGQLTTDN